MALWGWAMVGRVSGAPPGADPSPVGLTGADVGFIPLPRDAEGVLVFLLMLGIAAAVVVVGRRVMTSRGAGRGVNARGMAPGSFRGGPSGGSGNGRYGTAGGGEGQSRVVPFPPTAEDEPEWDNGGLRLGGGSETPGRPSAEVRVPPRLDELPARGVVVPVLVAASTVTGVVAGPVAVPVAAVMPVEVTAPAPRLVMMAPAGAEASGTVTVRVPVSAPVAMPVVAAVAEVPAAARPMGSRLKLTRSQGIPQPRTAAVTGLRR
jgi:hypothetical protein